jgi:FKBP-type peptidyl-prolyl cis-trans isomerase 2
MKLKKHDFIEVEFTGMLDDNSVFDTTDEAKAKKAGIADEKSKFGPVTVCLGESHLIKGLDEHLIGKEPGEFHITLLPENAFGKKDTKLLKLIPMKVFIKEKINPFPGLQVNIDNMYGTVRTVSGGRVIVDFNHPLSGRNVTYDLKVLRIVEDPLEKVKSLLKNELNFEPKLEINEGVLQIDEEIPKDALDSLKERILSLVPDIKDVSSKKPKKE